MGEPFGVEYRVVDREGVCEQTTERRERVARALRTDRYDARITNEALADAAIAAYESLEPEYEQVGWVSIHGAFYKVDAVRREWAEWHDCEPVYRRVVLPQEAEGPERRGSSHQFVEAEGTCPTCSGALHEPRRGCRACGGYSASNTGWWCDNGCGRDHGGMVECRDPFHSVSPNPEATGGA